MYKLSNKNCGSTEIVRVVIDEHGNEEEIYVCQSPLPEKEGDKFPEELVEFLNECNNNNIKSYKFN